MLGVARSSMMANPARPVPMRRRPPVEASFGNQATLRRLQAKLRVGAVNDPLEHEADRAADQVMAARPVSSLAQIGPAVSRKCEACALPSLDDDVAPVVSRSIAGGGQALDAPTRGFMETRFGRDFGGVRVHTDSTAAAGAAALGARAFTVGRDVVFGSGEYASGTTAGRHLLAHELAHTVQQGAASTPVVSRTPIPALSDGAPPMVQKADCSGYNYRTCKGKSCTHPTGSGGFCNWTGITGGCVCFKIESTISDLVKRVVLPALLALGVAIAAVEAVVALIACFASGACEFAMLVAAFGMAGALLIAKLFGSGSGGGASTAANDPAAAPTPTPDPASPPPDAAAAPA